MQPDGGDPAEDEASVTSRSTTTEMVGHNEDGSARGRLANWPWQMPLLGWRDVAMRVILEIQRDNIQLVAASVAFYAFLAIFPALAAVISVVGLIADPHLVEAQVGPALTLMPPAARAIIADQIQEIASTTGSSLSFGIIFGIVFAFWSAKKGTAALISAVGLAYEERENRGFLRTQLLAIQGTVVTVLGVIVAIFLLAAVPLVLERVPLGQYVIRWMHILRWFALTAGVMGFLGAFYRHAPARVPPKWRWVTVGSVVATCLWLLGSILFSLYTRVLADYNETYGAVGAFMALLLWFYMSSWCLLLGAEINAELEHQTTVDTTVGPGQPLGNRGAFVADNVGPVPTVDELLGRKSAARNVDA
jgi:membrane protein